MYSGILKIEGGEVEGGREGANPPAAEGGRKKSTLSNGLQNEAILRQPSYLPGTCERTGIVMLRQWRGGGFSETLLIATCENP